MIESYHIPVLLKESVDALNIKPDGIYVDVTFGGGGHSKEILKRLTTGKLFGFDRDADAQKNAPDDAKFVFVQSNYRYLKNFLRYYKVDKVDGILADLGVSSHHFDTAERGFSYQADAELDMRMDLNSKLTAREVINKYDDKQLLDMFSHYGEVENSKQLVRAIVAYRATNEIGRVSELKTAIQSCTPKFKENQYLSKVFQAIRIEVNNELEALKEMLMQSVKVLKPEGRLVVITYHSLEDRIVKNFIKAGNFEGEAEKDFFGHTEVPLITVNKKLILPGEEENKRNSRARSAKLRIAERAK
jgi:16S rRNA (cytosine1402-N4)-methyltransferase